MKQLFLELEVLGSGFSALKGPMLGGCISRAYLGAEPSPVQPNVTVPRQLWAWWPFLKMGLDGHPALSRDTAGLLMSPGTSG